MKLEKLTLTLENQTSTGLSNIYHTAGRHQPDDSQLGIKCLEPTHPYIHNTTHLGSVCLTWCARKTIFNAEIAS